jgi:hypothetical protein
MLGDGAFDGIGWQQALPQAGWSYVCRTGSHVIASWDGVGFRLATVRECLKAGTLVAFPQASVTREAYGPILLLCCWAPGYKEPLYLVSHLDCAEEACHLYAKRFRIETFFSDQQSRGFHLHKSPLSDQKRLARLLIAACFAYIWIVYLGALCEREGSRTLIHRGDRCDFSLFQLGLRFLDYLLNEDCFIPVDFHMNIERTKTVR